MPWPIVAATAILLALTGLFTLAVASGFRKVAARKGDLHPDQLRDIAMRLGIVLALLGASCLWLAYLALDWLPR